MATICIHLRRNHNFNFRILNWIWDGRAWSRCGRASATVGFVTQFYGQSFWRIFFLAQNKTKWFMWQNLFHHIMHRWISISTEFGLMWLGWVMVNKCGPAHDGSHFTIANCLMACDDRILRPLITWVRINGLKSSGDNRLSSPWAMLSSVFGRTACETHSHTYRIHIGMPLFFFAALTRLEWSVSRQSFHKLFGNWLTH